MTRAKDRLYLVHAHHRSTYGVGAQADPSRFLAELPEELLAAERSAAPFRRGGEWPRGTDDDGSWLPSGYRSPVRGRVNEPLRPITLPDLSAPRPVGRDLDAARERVTATSYEAARRSTGLRDVLRAGCRRCRRGGGGAGMEGRRPRHASALRRRDRREQPDRQGRRGGHRRIRRRGREAPDRRLRRAGARLLMGRDTLIADLRREREACSQPSHRSTPGR